MNHEYNWIMNHHLSYLSIFTAACLITLIPLEAEACRPRSDHKYPTLEQNFKSAKMVFVGQIESTKPSEKKQFITMEIKKAWKSSTPNKKSVTVMTNEPSSCDRLSYSTRPGDICLVFLTSDDVIVSNMLAGEASFCIPGDTPRAKTLINEFDEKFKNLTR